MKKSLLATGVALAAGFSASSFASPLAHPTSALFDAPGMMHLQTLANVRYDDTAGTGVNPLVGGGYNGFYHTSVGGSIFNINVTCTSDSLDASGNWDGTEPDQLAVAGVFPWGEIPMVGILPFGYIERIPQGACDIDIGAHGEITAGWQFSGPFVDFEGVDTYTVIDWGERYSTNWQGATCPTGVPASMRSLASDAVATLRAEIAAGNSVAGGALEALMTSPPPAGCIVSGIEDLSLGQCDPAFEAENVAYCTPALSKAVPVPAFAAGALALGLAGVTYLTSRRRQVK